MRVLGIYGGSFDPPHVAHVLACSYALAVGGFDELVVVPVFHHAFNKRLAPFEHRARMCELAFRDLGRARVSRVEANLPVPSRTLQTLRAIAEEHPDTSLRLIVGSDVLGDAHKWHAFEEIRKLAPLFVIGRVGYDGHQTCALPAVSSTQVRTLLARADEPEALDQLRELVPSAVLEYALSYGLYAGEDSGTRSRHP